MQRYAPINISEEDFKKIGYALVDTIAAFFANINDRPVTTGETSAQLKQLLGNASLPEKGSDAGTLINHAADLVLNHSLLNGHPKFMGYITGAPAPIGALADMLAATVNPNVGAQILSPMATEIEKQTVQWLSAFLGLPNGYAGILVSGGNMANFTAFLAGRTAKAPKHIKEEGVSQSTEKMRVYCAKTTHTWIEKAAVLFGLGTKAIRWIETDADNKMNIEKLDEAIRNDLAQDFVPIMIVGTAGDVSTGAVDDLRAISLVCKKYDCWFHVDGAYGIPAVVVPAYAHLFDGLEEADSIAMDPHKWLYSPLEAGCTLVKEARHLTDTFSSHPDYYKFNSEGDDEVQNFYEFGLQNSRGFRALKVWLMLQQMGRSGYEQMINEDIELAKLFYALADAHPELEAVSQHLSITTLRYLPKEAIKHDDAYLNKLNEALLNKLQHGGEAFLSNAMVRGKYCLRACIVNFRTTEKDIEEIADIIVREGSLMHEELQRQMH
jgi:glutamate/tyrosine decarboxylase-like PLP-dependent enzyme